MPEGSSILAFLGSIKTAKETLALIYDAPRTLEKTGLEYKIASLTKILTELENQARDFEKIIRDKEIEIGRLKNLLNKKAMFKAENLSDECIEILKLLVHSEESPINYIATRLKMSEQKIKYFLDKLEEVQLVSHTFPSYDVGKAYSLNENGRKFLFEKELL